jgi:P-type conjugative transfer protein TrbG
MPNHPLLKPFLVSLLLACAAEKIVAQSHPVESISQKKVTTHNLSRMQRSVTKPTTAPPVRLDDPAVKSAAKTNKASAVLTDGFIRFTYQLAQSPLVNTAPLQETVIHLEVGEHYTNISSGDPNRWSYAVAVSGSGKTEQQHVLVKPSLPELSTNLIIATDRRLYHLQLVSMPTKPVTRAVRFDYPPSCMSMSSSDKAEDKDAHSGEKVPSVMHVDYQLSRTHLFGSAPAWWPKQVFDDGEKSYIVFPDAVKQQYLPVLFIVDNEQPELVNYRFKDNHFVVDKVFDKALLVSGVGQSEQSVLIRRIT